MSEIPKYARDAISKDPESYGCVAPPHEEPTQKDYEKAADDDALVREVIREAQALVDDMEHPPRVARISAPLRAALAKLDKETE